MLSIFSWNIQQGGGSRMRKIVEELIVLKPTIIVLSEFRNNEKGAYLRDKLLQVGYRYQGVTAADAQENSVIVLSIIPGDVILHPKSDPTYGSSIIEFSLEAISIIGVYLPHKKKHVLFDYIHKVIGETDKPFIIAGDYNTGINKIDQAGTSFWYEDKMKHFEKLNYIDAFRKLHGDAKEYSWYSHQGNGYRYDHTYIDADIQSLVTRCDYLHAWREEKLSDHSPMILELSF